ncbi:unnamed protein product [Rhizoctonia solani]|uniref:Uncharacterized protein n=1 Tax=Rhizoctonia solani TaxID=456999 RepID=A0A8H3EE47_9AGAM|nr:unnamed protein product [Rhizoctonia solani]
MSAVGTPHTIKLVIIGDSGVGKSCFRNQYITGRFSTAYRATIGADFIAKRLPHHSKPEQGVVLQIWDTAGQERFSALSSAFFRGADAAIFMFDATRPDSVAELRRWWNQFVVKCPVFEGSEANFCAVFVGNKVDLLPDQERHTNGSSSAEDRAQRRGEPNGGDPPITDTLVRRFLQDLIPTKPDSAPAQASSKRRTIHIDDLSEGSFLPAPEDEATIKPVQRPDSFQEDVIAESPQFPVVGYESLETGPKLFWSSARTGEGVSPVFEYVACRVVQRREWEESRLGFDEGIEEGDGPTAMRLREDWGKGNLSLLTGVGLFLGSIVLVRNFGDLLIPA